MSCDRYEKRFPKPLHGTRDSEYDKAIFVYERDYCTYADLREYRKKKQNGTQTQATVTSPIKETPGIGGALRFKSPESCKLQKKIMTRIRNQDMYQKSKNKGVG